MNTILPVLIPLKDGHELSYKVLKALVKQTIDVDVICVSRPEESSDKSRFPDNGWKSMSKCRNIAKNKALKKYDSKYFLFLNRDVELGGDKDLEDLITFLEDNENFIAVAINTRNKEIKKLIDTHHTDIACALFRREALEELEFNNSYGCNCRGVCVYALSNKKKIGYIDHRKSLEK